VVEDPSAGRLRLEGTARLLAPGDPEGVAPPIGGRRAPERGVDVRLQGDFVFDRARDHFTRFDLLAWGEAWGHGRYTPRPPPGRFPLLIAFSLAGDRPADRVPPQGSRGRSDYFGPGGATASQ
jgi:hypothetical protein